jgi:hypothetical protein
MAKQKFGVISIVAVVGLIALVLATSGGFFKNFSVQNNGLQISISDILAQGGSIVIVDYKTVGGTGAHPNILYTLYIDGNSYSTFGGTSQGSQVLDLPNGAHTAYIYGSEQSSGFSGQSATISFTITGSSVSPTPTPSQNPTPTPTHSGNPTPTPPILGQKDIFQQIMDFLNSLFKPIIDFFKSIGLWK